MLNCLNHMIATREGYQYIWKMETFYKRRKLILEDGLLKGIGRKKNIWKSLDISLGDTVGNMARFKVNYSLQVS